MANEAEEYARVSAAIQTLIEHLEKGWVVKECEGDSMFGCASCQALRLVSELHGFQHALDENEGRRMAHNG